MLTYIPQGAWYSNFGTKLGQCYFEGDVDINNILVSSKISFGEKNCKYFIGYMYDDYRIKPLHIMFPKTEVYVKRYDGQIKWMYFLIKNDDLLEKYNTIWDKVSAGIKNKIL